MMMVNQHGERRQVREDDMVQSLSTKRCYFVTSVRGGKINLWKHGHRRIKNANPDKYRIVERDLL